MKFPVDIPNQNFALISYVGPNTKPNCGTFAIRIYGTFLTFDEADKVASKAQEYGYDLFDLEIVDIGHGFIPLPPPVDQKINKVIYDKQINLTKLMTEHKENMLRQSRMLNERADADHDLRSPVEVFEEMVTKGAIKLFNEWKAKNKKDNKKTIKKKLEKEWKKNIQNILKDEHGVENEKTKITEKKMQQLTSKSKLHKSMQHKHQPKKVQVISGSKDKSRPTPTVLTIEEIKRSDPNAFIMPSMKCAPIKKKT
jgi:hypothetical protein